MAEKELQIQMFGGFTMRYGGEGLAINKTGSSKSVRLLQMLLLSLDGGISKNELIDNLYGWSEKADMANRNRNLNNLLYRLKKQLISCGLPKEEYATICEGMCFFKTNVPIKQDTKLFEIMVERARRADGGGRSHPPALAGQRDVLRPAASGQPVGDVVFPEKQLL